MQYLENADRKNRKEAKLPERKPLRSLAPEIAERIAAGEVIERPASVVKELIENALDAGAREVRIEIRGGGLRLVRVIDDGDGIPAEDLERVWLRHTTSKIATLEDLERLETLGFRGEALFSIATIAELTILSRTRETAKDPEQSGYFLLIRGGQIESRGQGARVPGTTVTVRDLFYNVPARLKFMRGARTEAMHILQLVRRYALGYPQVRFSLLNDESSILQTGGSGDLAIALAELYQLPLEEMVRRVEVSQRFEENLEAPHYHLHGYIGNRALAQNNRQHVMLFINGRLVQVKGLQDALEEGYRGLLPRGKHPLIVLHLSVPPEEIDANVHPAKLEVKLLREAEVASLLTQAVRSVLGSSPALPESPTLPGPNLISQRRLPGARRRGLHLSESVQPYQRDGGGEPALSEILRTLRPLAQLQEALILAQSPDGSLYIIDQHRAHERIIYEHLRQTYSSGKRVKEDEEDLNAHLLLEPVIVEMKRHQAELLTERLPILRGLGLDCERFGGRSFLIRSVPVGLSESEGQMIAALPELAGIAAEESPDWQDRLLIGLSCRSALRRGRVMGLDEQGHLLRELARVAAPAVCPHGSPILLEYSRAFFIEKFEW